MTEECPECHANEMVHVTTHQGEDVLRCDQCGHWDWDRPEPIPLKESTCVRCLEPIDPGTCCFAVYGGTMLEEGFINEGLEGYCHPSCEGTARFQLRGH